MSYIDGIVAAVPTANREAFIRHSSGIAAIFKNSGATSVVDCWGDGVPEGKLTSFTMAVKREDNETWSSRGCRGRRAPPATTAGRRSWPTRACSPGRRRCRSTASE